jgi:hypothetical protein
LLSQRLNDFVVVAQGSKLEFVVEPDVVPCRVGMFLPQTMAVFTDGILQHQLLSVSRQREANGATRWANSFSISGIKPNAEMRVLSLK